MEGLAEETILVEEALERAGEFSLSRAELLDHLRAVEQQLLS